MLARPGSQEISHTGYFERNRQIGEGFWSAGYCRLLGIDPCINGDHEMVIKLVHPDDREFVVQKLSRVRQGDDDSEFDFRIIRPDGEIRHIHSINRNSFSKNGELYSTYGTFQDITRVV